MTMYQLINDHVVRKLPENIDIVFGEDNPDYQEYLKWLAEGNEPLPADD